MPYESSVAFRGSPAPAIDAARLILIGQGFAVTEPQAGHLLATAPWMTSTGRTPLAGISWIRIETSGTTMTVTAGRRNTVVMVLFLVLFPPALAAVLGMMHGAFNNALRAVVPWMAAGPVLALWLWYRTKLAFARFVDNLARIGG
jgi:hypothetical protein